MASGLWKLSPKVCRRAGELQSNRAALGTLRKPTHIAARRQNANRVTCRPSTLHIIQVLQVFHDHIRGSSNALIAGNVLNAYDAGRISHQHVMKHCALVRVGADMQRIHSLTAGHAQASEQDKGCRPLQAHGWNMSLHQSVRNWAIREGRDCAAAVHAHLMAEAAA